MWAGSITTADTQIDGRGPSQGLIDWLRGQNAPWPGPALAKELGTDHAFREERVRSGPSNVVFPWFLPYFDQNQSQGETAQIRAAYRLMMADPNVKAAVLGKVLAVCSLDPKVIPVSKTGKRDAEVASWVQYNLEECLAGGVSGLIWSVLSGAMVDGYSVNEKVWKPEERGKYAGKYALRALKPKDVGNDVLLETDEFRNVIGIRGLRYNAGAIYHPSNFVLYRHLPFYDSPVGTSDFRAVYSRWHMLDTVLKLRAVGLEKRSLPMLMGFYQTPQQRPSLEEALAAARAQSWLAIPEGVRIEALNIAGSADASFGEAVKDLKHDIFLGIQGAVLQALEGGTPSGRGSSQVHRTTADLLVWHLAQSVEHLLNDREFGLVRDVVDLNYVVMEYPKVRLSAVDVDEQIREAELDTRIHSWGVDLSKDDVYERYNRKPPTDEEDRIPGGGGQGPPGGKPPGSGKDPGEPPMPGGPNESDSLPEGAGDFSDFFADSDLEFFGEGPRRFASTQFNLASDDASRVQALAAKIEDEDLAGDGREDEPHLTVKYGLHSDDPDAVRAAVQGFGPVRVRLGPVSVFPAKDEDGADVVKIDVEGDSIRRLNRTVCNACEHTNTHAGYRPHITLAYVKPGSGAKYAGRHPLQGETLTFDTLIFSPREGERTSIPLGGRFSDFDDGWDESKHPRKGGKFAPKGSGGESSKIDDAGHKTVQPVGKIQKPSLTDSKGVVRQAIAHLGGAVPATKAAAARLGSAAWATLNPHEQKMFVSAYAVGKWVMHHAETGLRKGKQAAIAAAKERGLSDEQAQRVGKIVGIVDTIAAWTVNVPGATIATGNPLVGKAAGLFPVASAAYLAYSAARNPLAVLRAAKTALATRSQQHAEFVHLFTDPAGEGLDALLAGIERAGDRSEWYVALVSVALDQNGHDLAKAVEAADQVASEPPADLFAEGDWDESKHPRAEDGKFGKGGGSGKKSGKAKSSATSASGKPATQKKAAADDKSKFIGQKVGKAEHEHSGEVEREIAGHVGGEWEEDNLPYDVLVGKNGFEVKSFLKGRKQSISVHEDALLRKVDWVAEEPGRVFHTIVADERDHYGGGEFAEHFSGHRLYYKRGSGRYSVSKMHKVQDAAELSRLTRMSEDELPEAARGSLPSSPEAIRKLREAAERAHASRLAKDRARKARLKAAKAGGGL